MVRHNLTTDYREKMLGGSGIAEVTPFVTNDEMLNKGRMFGRILLRPGCGLGYHVHEKDTELIYILRGTGVYNDNGTVIRVCTGDVCVCPVGEGHCIRNESDEDLEVIALILFA